MESYFIGSFNFWIGLLLDKYHLISCYVEGFIAPYHSEFVKVQNRTWLSNQRQKVVRDGSKSKIINFLH